MPRFDGVALTAANRADKFEPQPREGVDRYGSITVVCDQASVNTKPRVYGGQFYLKLTPSVPVSGGLAAP